MNHSNPKLIAKNTVVLYVRTIITMVIALYTSRVVLKALGVDDYGLYHVVGGIVTILSVVNAGLRSATQRFLSYALGKNDKTELAHVFGVCFVTHCLFAILILLLGLTVGIWFLNNYIQIPDGRETAAFWIYIFSLFTVCVNLLMIPFSACVVSHERMTAFAYIGIIDAVLKLIIAIAVGYVNGDKLIYYGGFIGVISLLNFIIYYFICYKSHPESHTLFYWDKQLFKQTFSFMSWNMLGQGAMVCNAQGSNIIINLFYSVTANAANSIANQVNAALKALTGNFLAAYQPQITKSYASGNFQYIRKLMIGTTKLSFYLVAVVSLPIILNIDIILKVWLGDVPQFTGIFCTLFIFSSIINSIGNPAWTVIMASGNIKKLQAVSSCIYMFGIVLVYVLFKVGLPVYFAPLSKLFVDICLTVYRLILVKGSLPDNTYMEILKGMLLPIVIVSFFIIIIGLVVSYMIPEGISRLMASIVSLIVLAVLVYRIGLTQNERLLVLSFIPLNKYVKKN